LPGYEVLLGIPKYLTRGGEVHTQVLKKVAAAVAAGGLAMTLAACGGDNATETPSSGESQASSSGETVELSFYAYQSMSVMQPIVDAFMESHPNIKIEVSDRGSGSGGEYANILQTRIAGNQTPDIFHIVSENRAEIVDNGVALDLTGMPVLDTVDPSWLDLYRNGDEVYGMTFTAWMGGVIYNKDLLEEVGYSEVPDTWDEFIKLGKALKDKGIAPYFEEQGIASGSLTSLLASSFQAGGHSSADWALDGRPAGQTFAEAWTPVLQEWDKAVKAGVLPQESIALDGDQIKSAFLNGEVAMMRSGNWHQAEIEDVGINYGFAAFPAYPGGETYINGGGDPAYSISAASAPEKQEAAKEFIEYLGSAEGLKPLVEGTGAMSISSAYASDPAPAFEDAYKNNLLTGRKYWLDWSKGSGPMISTMSSEQQLLIQGQATPEDFAKAMDAESDKLS
jgi:ABC-type sugar transport system, periplasmic component